MQQPRNWWRASLRLWAVLSVLGLLLCVAGAPSLREGLTTGVVLPLIALALLYGFRWVAQGLKGSE